MTEGRSLLITVAGLALMMPALLYPTVSSFVSGIAIGGCALVVGSAFYRLRGTFVQMTTLDTRQIPADIIGDDADFFPCMPVA